MAAPSPSVFFSCVITLGLKRRQKSDMMLDAVGGRRLRGFEGVIRLHTSLVIIFFRFGGGAYVYVGPSTIYGTVLGFQTKKRIRYFSGKK
jgi:hypothetical protein